MGSMESRIFVGIIAICVIFIIVCIVRKKPERIINFVLRTLIGTAGIYLLDFVLRSNGLEVNVGINAATVLTNGILGLPGFIMLYGLAAYYTYG